MLGLWFLLVLFLSSVSDAYIPAQATNSTKDAIDGGLNVTDISNLHLQWATGSTKEHVAYRIVGVGSLGITRGALVHFSEDIAGALTEPIDAPWIALVSCDKNATYTSADVDIFTRARDLGAQSALLYSLTSAACIVNTEYLDPEKFEKVLDVFSAQSSASSHLIEWQFGQLVPGNGTMLDFDPALLRANNESIHAAARGAVGAPTNGHFLMATLQAYNATDPRLDSTTLTPSNDQVPVSSGSSSTALAMIVLYAITGCVSALFCVVIISGAVRAIRYPERYGPRSRAGDDGLPPQSRAQGLTRAILETFPLVKFGTTTTAQQDRDKDPESLSGFPSSDIEMKPQQQSDLPLRASRTLSDSPLKPAHEALSFSISPSTTPDQSHPSHPASGASSSSPPVPVPQTTESREETSTWDHLRPPIQRATVLEDVVPAAIGRETCPICIVDFQEGDDIRVLPCEGKHCFHQQCVDPWLLQLSSSCPICRHDFLALENMLSEQEAGDEYDADYDLRPAPTRISQGNRFSRYVRFALQRRRHRHDEVEEDPTDPYSEPRVPQATSQSGQ